LGLHAENGGDSKGVNIISNLASEFAMPAMKFADIAI